jgi:hypothetical protein
MMGDDINMVQHFMTHFFIDECRQNVFFRIIDKRLYYFKTSMVLYEVIH